MRSTTNKERSLVPISSEFNGLLVDPEDAIKEGERVGQTYPIEFIMTGGGDQKRIQQNGRAWLQSIAETNEALGTRSRIVEATTKDGVAHLVELFSSK
jgi:hypothetical protein